MNFDRFQLVDRIISLNIESRTIEVEAQVPAAQLASLKAIFPAIP